MFWLKKPIRTTKINQQKVMIYKNIISEQIKIILLLHQLRERVLQHFKIGQRTTGNWLIGTKQYQDQGLLNQFSSSQNQ